MFRLAVAVSLLVSAVCAVAQNAPSSDPFAVSLAQKSVAALTGGTTISDVTLKANVTSILGSDYESGTGTFQAKGTGESRSDLNLSTSGTRTDVRNLVSGAPAGAWGKNGGTSTAYAGHNCWTDAAWFFPAFSSLTQMANPNFIFKYIGPERHGGVNSQHIQIYQLAAQGQPPSVQRLSKMDFYLDAASSLPLGINFDTHADDDMNLNIPVAINFANYQPVQGIQVPFHIQRMLNGGVVLDATVTSAGFNTGLSDSLFTIQ
jgi:hypothetical protein